MKRMSILGALALTAVLATVTGAEALSCKGPCPSFGGGNGGGSSYYCGDELLAMRSVKPEQIAAIGAGAKVSVMPFCEGEESGPLRVMGNAGKLRGPIGENPVLLAALVEADFAPKDVIAVEKTQRYRGRYHVLQGHLDPIRGIGGEQLRVSELNKRIDDESITEIIVCTNPNIEGEATALYVAKEVRDRHPDVNLFASNRAPFFPESVQFGDFM